MNSDNTGDVIHTHINYFIAVQWCIQYEFIFIVLLSGILNYSHIFILGHRDQYGAYELVVTGHVTGISGFGGATIFVIVQKRTDDPIAVAVVVDVKAIAPIIAISTLIKKDLKDITLIKDFTTDLIIEYAIGEMMLLNDTILNKLLAKYIANAKTVTEGMSHIVL